MENCPDCGTRLTPGARFCAACGAPTDSEETRYAPGPSSPGLTSEETRVAASARPRPAQPAPRPVEPLQVRPLAPPPERRESSPRAAAPDTEEQTIFTVRPTLLFVKLGYALAVLGAFLVIALLAWQPWLAIPFYVSLPLALLVFLLPAYKHLMRNTVRYTLTDSKVEIDQGFISRTTRNLPLRNIQDVSVTTTIPQRLLRFGNVVIDNASEVGGTTVLRNIPDPRRHADQILRELRRWR
ncbi:MAG TPA: PH domain-containing protein [Pyrinomonadaceae bacterium]|jgi:membrane protein YdbS with pleckstrin-like domain